MFHSLAWDELPEPIRAYLSARQIGPGDRVYLRKLPAIHDRALADARAADRQTVRELAERFSRDPRTIARRLGRLRSSAEPVETASHARTSSEEASLKSA